MAKEGLSAQAVGRLGELAIEQELLKRGWIVGNFNAAMANTVAYDLFAVKKKQRICVRVKTTSSDSVQYTAKHDGAIFRGLQPDDEGDYAAIVLMENATVKSIYILPTAIVDKTLRHAQEEWMSHTKRDGAPRKETNHRALFFTGKWTASSPHRGMQQAWAQYKDGWHLLEG